MALGQFLLDLSIRKKLFLGFGIILAILLGISIVSFNTLINLTGSFDFVRATYESNLRISDASTQEKNFILHRDPQSGHQLEKLLSEARAMAEQAQLLMTDEADIQETAIFIDDLDKYRQAFSQLVQTLAADPQADTTQLEEEIDRLGTDARKIASAFGAKQQQLLLQETVMAERIIIVVAVFALVLGILTVILITRMIVPPLQQAVSIAEKIASGDLSQNLENHRKDEPGQLINAMQRMTESLRNLVHHLTSGITQLATATEEMAAISEQNSVGVNQQRAETEQVATAMNEMAATVQEVARSAEDASNAATESAQQAHLGDKVVQETMQQIRQLAQEVTTSADAITELKEQTNNIGAVLDVIKSVADQTNLLALNAAIEAARAGEAGRGFAVVAEEVRALAFRTQESTVQIENLISTLQHKAEHAATSMTRSADLADTTLSTADSAGDAINTINQAISNIQHMNQQIAAAALQQSTVAEEISCSITSIRDIAEQSAAASEETATASADLSRLGIELQALAGTFRL
ncbi:methyl-accepting chemotaxis protein [Chromatiaceae bacterium AAb-1]|nr:methyl-accepting chemotaxis protein [Chromatiaceae bacterium AAb-1]